jgi:TRAP transporter TAXI family solute receptor
MRRYAFVILAKSTHMVRRGNARACRILVRCLAFIAVLPLLYVTVPQAMAQKEPMRLTAASTSVGSPPYVIVANFAEAAKKGLPPGSSINVESSGTTANAARIGEGKLDMGLVNIIDVALAIQGKPPFTKKLGKIRVLCGLTLPESEEYLFMVAKSTGLNSIEEIKQKHFPLTLALPMKGSGSELLTGMVLNAYGITYEDIHSWGGKVIFTSFVEQRNLFKDSRVQAMGAIQPYPHPGITEICTFRKDVMFIPVDKETVVKELRKSGVIPVTMKKGHYGITDRDIATVASPSFMGVRADLPDDVVQMVLKGVFDNIDILRKAHKTMQNFTLELSYQYVSSPTELVPFHPAAEKFFKERLGRK